MLDCPSVRYPSPTSCRAFEALQDPGDRIKELAALVDPHFQDVADRPSLEANLEGLAVEPLAAADLARDMKIGKKVHRQPTLAEPPTRLTAAPLGVEAESTGAIASNLGFAGQGEDPADLVINAGRRGGGRARAAANRALIDLDELVDRLEPHDPLSAGAAGTSPLEKAADRAGQHVVDQRALARPADPGHTRDRCQRDLSVDLLQVMKGCPVNLDPAWTGGEARARPAGEPQTCARGNGP